MGRSPSAPGTPRSDGSQVDSRGESEDEGSEDALVGVGNDTRPGTPLAGKGLTLGMRAKKDRGKDPLRNLPTHLAVRVFLQLDIRSLARCNRVCKRWQKSSTLNYVWFLQNRALTLPMAHMLTPTGQGKMHITGDDTPDYFDPYDKTPRLASLPQPPMPTSAQPQWTKAESKRQWRPLFRATLKREDPNREDEIDPLRVTFESLHSSGTSTPGGGHSWVGQGSGGASRWAASGQGSMTPTERKVAAREGYKALGGRKARNKRKMGGELGSKDKGAVVDDGRFDAPW